MIRVSHLLKACVGFAALALSACSTPLTNGPEQVFDPITGFPITVQPRMMTLRLLYNGQPELDGNTVGQIARFAGDYLSHGSGSLAVVPPSANPAVSDLVVNALLEFGVARTQIMVGSANAPGPSDDIRLTFIRYVAETPACGDWSTDLSRTGSNTPNPNFGCASRRNLAAMVSDPRDLLTPDTSGQADAQRRMQVLTRYRRGEVTAAEERQDQNAVISNVARQ